VADVVNAYMMGSDYLDKQCAAGHNAFAVTTGEFLRLKDFVALFENAACKKLNIHWGQRPCRLREVMKPWDTGEQLPGWKPTISLAAGIADLLGKHILI
jgi:hypothetical protein